MYNARFFSDNELRCKCGCFSLPQNGMNEELLQRLDRLREIVGEPIHVSSGYRCSNHEIEAPRVEQRGYGGQHWFGKAVDIYCDNLTMDELADLATSVGFRGVERNDLLDYVHVDVREEPYYWRFDGDEHPCDEKGNLI